MKRKRLIRQNSPWMEVLSRFMRNRLAMLGAIILILLILSAVFADVLAPYGLDDQDVSRALQGPSSEHLFGTDKFGRDQFSRVLYGGRISLRVGIVAVGVALLFGGTLGVIAGYVGGKVDSVIMRVMDVLMAVPGMLLAVAIAASLGAGLGNMMIAIGIGNVPGYARITRAAVMSAKGNEYVEAARATGAGNLRIILRHILPNSIAPVIVQATLGVASSITACAMLSLLGLGAAPPTPEWGGMLSTARDYLRTHAYMAIFPGLFIMITVFSLNVMGDGLRDAIDPRLKD